MPSFSFYTALVRQDIEIKASGESARMCLYAFDAVSALMTLLFQGGNGTAYNVSNKDNYCSIRILAETIVKVVGGASHVLVKTGTDEEQHIYPPDSFLYLDTLRLEKLGWKAQYNLNESIRNLMKWMVKNA